MDKKALVVIDYQNDFVDGALGFPKAKLLEEGIYNEVNNAILSNTPVFFTLDIHNDDYSTTREGRNLPVMHCAEGSDGAALYGRLKEFLGKDGIWMITKGSFGSDKLPNAIKQNIGAPNKIEICGIVTNMCVISNAIILQSAFPNADITIKTLLCASFDEQMHQKALDVMGSMHMTLS